MGPPTALPVHGAGGRLELMHVTVGMVGCSTQLSTVIVVPQYVTHADSVGVATPAG